MKFLRRSGFALWAAIGCMVQPANAQSYPDRTVEIVVPFAPGGTLDLSTRFLADKWAEFLGKPVVVLNKPGAGSALGARYVTNAAPDGYTLFAGSESPLIIARLLLKDIEYNLDSFSYLFGYGKGAIYLTVKSDARWKSLREFIDEARTKPGGLTYATHGNGTLSHFIAESFWRENGVSVTHIPYKTGPEGNNAVLGGHVNMAFPPALGGLVRENGVRALATTSDERMPSAPNVPTLKELGFKSSLIYYCMLLGPPNLPKHVLDKWNEVNEKVFAKYGPEIAEKMKSLDLAAARLSGPEALQNMRAREAWLRNIAQQLGMAK